MRMLHFIDAAGTDETIISSDNIAFIQVQDADVVWVYFRGPAAIAGSFTDVEFDKVILTGATFANEIALRLAEEMTATHPVAPMLTIKAATAPFAELTAVAYTTGA